MRTMSIGKDEASKGEYALLLSSVFLLKYDALENSTDHFFSKKSVPDIFISFIQFMEHFRVKLIVFACLRMLLYILLQQQS